ncbi:TonB-dependent receptor [Burkholderiaceae bacterium DAT-1]|nr:TonB-dependent receptor [Burkholderiaceae bacterium DAT-1]
MKFQPTPAASAIALALLALSVPTFAEESAKGTQEAKDSTSVEAITVTGIRASKQRSLAAKRNAESIVEVVTSEDIGKMPDKNVADTLQRVPGVNTTAGGAAGSLGENEKVSMRGMSDAYTLTTVNGHGIATADWFWADIANGGRSVSYSLLPSDIVGSIVVHKSSQADLPEGGLSGSVDIQTRRPLDFKDQLTTMGSAGGAYQSFARNWDPQLAGLVSWKNDTNTFGITMQAFSQKRSLKREEQENVWYVYDDLSWNENSNKALAAAGVDITKPHRLAPLTGSAVFEQKRTREGGVLDVQFKPSNELTLGLNAFTSTLKASNSNINWMQDPWASLNQGIVPSVAHVSNGVIDQLAFDGSCKIATGATGKCSDAASSAVDIAVRPDAKTETNYFAGDFKYRLNENLDISGQAGQSKSTGHSKDIGFEIFGPHVANSYKINGGDAGISVNFPSATVFQARYGSNTDLNDPDHLPVGGWTNMMDTTDTESFFNADAKLKLDSDVFNWLKVGVRSVEHKRDLNWIAGARPAAAGLLSNAPAGAVSTYSFGASGLQNFWTIDPSAITSWSDRWTSFPSQNHDYSKEFSFKETVNAAYVMAGFSGNHFSGNIGVRFVQTKDNVDAYRLNNESGTIAQGVPGSKDKYSPFSSSVTFNNTLPSGNISFDLADDTKIRVAASRTLSHPDYGQYAGLNLNDYTLTGTGSNPKIKPVLSDNLDITYEYYFAPRSIVTAGIFSSKLDGYVTNGNYTLNAYNALNKKNEDFAVAGPTNTTAKVSGIEFSAQYALGGGFGVDGNYTYADGKETGNVANSLCAGATHDCHLLGTSKNTYNVGVYFENETFNARIGYTERSDFLFGTNPKKAVYVHNGGNLSAAFNYNVSKSLTVSVEGQNLLDPKLYTYAPNGDFGSAGHQGRTYFVTLRGKY